MAFEVITTNPGTPYTVNSTDVVVLPRDVILTSASDGFQAGANPFQEVSLRISGQVYAGLNGIDFWGPLGGTTSYNFNEIWIASTGVVSGLQFGIQTESGQSNSITNYGQIVGDIGVQTYGGINHSITNGGSITGLAGEAVLVNVEVNTSGFGNCVIINQATGTLHSDTASAVVLTQLAGGSRIHNVGLISSGFAFGIDLVGVGAGQDVISIINHGTILGWQGAFSGSVNADSLVNRGSLVGEVVTNAGNDTLDNRFGTIDGDVLLGADADTFDNRGGTVLGTVFGDAGQDIFRGNADEAETFNGGADADTLDFRFGAAVTVALDGSFDNAGAALGDVYAAFERVNGSAEADVIRGNGTGNTLTGGSGDDTIDGAAGADVIRGGTGVDLVTGGLGSDFFRFNSASEFGDVITDFLNVGGNNDRFQIAASIGGGLAAGLLAASQFQSRADNQAQDADDRFIFRTTDRTLWFDADGNGAGAAVLVADLQAGATLTAADIQII